MDYWWLSLVAMLIKCPAGKLVGMIMIIIFIPEVIPAHFESSLIEWKVGFQLTDWCRRAGGGGKDGSEILDMV